MLDADTKRRIDTCRDILVGKVPDPKSQVEQITIALIYKFMDDMDAEAEELGGKRAFFAGDFATYGWAKLMAPNLGGFDVLNLYSEAIGKMNENPGVPPLFRNIFKNAYLPYRDPETLRSFLKEINGFRYDHSERLGDAFEYLLSVLGSQGDAGQFRTPRHIIDFIVAIIDPQKDETILDPACGTAGFLISAYKHILNQNTQTRIGDLLTPDERKRLAVNIHGYDISPDMVRLSLVNLYLHGFTNPRIEEYDTLTSEDHWHEYADVILANPPFMSPKGGIKPHKRFTVQVNRSEVLFVDYIAEHLTPQGRAAIIVPEGIIFQSGTAYKNLRKLLVEQTLVAVISLPAGVFNPYSGVKTSILLLDRKLAKKSASILFAKISNDGFGLGAQRRAIEKNDLPEIVQQIKAWLASVSDGNEFDATANPNLHLVEKSRIGENGEWNLSGERYRESALKPSTFECHKIGDLFTTSSGGTPLKSRLEFYESGTIPWLKSGEVAQGFVYHSEEFITEEGLVNSSAKIFPINTVLIAMYGATAGQVGLLKFEAATNQAICGIYPDEKIIPEFLFHMLRAKRNYLIDLSSGGAQPNISQGIIRDLEIPLPPLAVQQEIVAEIEGYQKIIDGARQVVENYQPCIAIHPDWPVVLIDNLSERVTKGSSPNWQGISYTSERDGILFITSENVGNGVLLIDNKKYVEPRFNQIEQKSILKKGDILTNIVGASIGRTAVFDLAEEVANVNQAVCIIRPKSELANSEFIMHIMNSEWFIQKLLGNSVENARANVSMGVLKGMGIPVPDLDTQRAIVAEIEEEQRLVDANRALIRRFEAKIKTTINRVWGEAA